LGVRNLHERGITGRGVRIAILDQPLLVDHQEYADRLQLYEEIHIPHDAGPQMHGLAVASIAVGKTVGVAPEAELFYIAFSLREREKGGAQTYRYLAQGIYRILEINEQLPKDNRIRVISISKGLRPTDKEWDLISEAVQKAQAAGILVVCTTVESFHKGYGIDGLGRTSLADPDIFESYERGYFYDKIEGFWAGHISASEGHIWAPMDSRTTASPKSINEYVFYRKGGLSWSVPYIAGVYALAVQVNPAITPERFWALTARTGRALEVEREGKRHSVGFIIDPAKLIRSIRTAKDG
jgi:hypothetical protein